LRCNNCGLLRTLICRVKGKAIRIQAWRGPLGPQEFEAPRISRQSVHEGGKFVRSKHRPPLLPKRYPTYLFVLKIESTPKPFCFRKDKGNEKSKWPLTAFSAVPQPSSSLRTLSNKGYGILRKELKIFCGTVVELFITSIRVDRLWSYLASAATVQPGRDLQDHVKRNFR
jgi:hypothetical protein